jgi:hypothetical protein
MHEYPGHFRLQLFFWYRSRAVGNEAGWAKSLLVPWDPALQRLINGLAILPSNDRFVDVRRL